MSLPDNRVCKLIAFLTLAVPAVGQENGSKGELPPAATLDAPLRSIVRGRVLLYGEIPKASIIEQIKSSPDRACCWDAAPDIDKRQQTWRIRDGGVENVIVLLEPPADKSFGKLQFKGTVVIDQPFCQFAPRVVVARPGESITFRNSSKIHHSIAYSGQPGIVASNQEKLLILRPEKRPLEISCAIHAWMTGYIWPTDNPYSTVSRDRGVFELKDVPTGVKLNVKYWHESNPKFVQHGTIETKEGDNTLEIKIKPN